MEARRHPRQSDRLRALYSYEILDTDREREFDDVVQLAAQICGTAIAVINLIDAERQWFKAEVGLGVRETPLPTSLCAHVILEEDFVEIEDTLRDPRMAENPLCCGEPGLRFYAGALLRSDEGLPLGTLCVLDWQPRRLTPVQRDAIRVLAGQVMAQLNLRRAMREAQVLRQEVDHRVKNSLSTLTALALLEGEAASSEEARTALGRMRSRIGTVATLHEELYKAGAAGGVDLGAYVERIGRFLREVAPAHVAVEFDVEPAPVSARQASSVGILLNELATNAFKHGFNDRLTDGRIGRVVLGVDQLPDGRIRVECADDGAGLPPGFEAQRGMGMRIVDLVCAQLDCELELEPRGSGTGLRARFVFSPSD